MTMHSFSPDMVEVSHCADAEFGRLDEAFEYAAHEIRAALTLSDIDRPSVQCLPHLGETFPKVRG
jgi:hypothetical protein